MKILYIDTSDNKCAKVRLQAEDKVFVRQTDAEVHNRSQETLSLIQQILKEADISLTDIDKINVVKGPGSFTGLKVGVTIANTLSFCLQRPVNDKKISENEIPIY
jgi:tRNA threonylcarbamoyladenosine biosynthesis protein TsaB